MRSRSRGLVALIALASALSAPGAASAEPAENAGPGIVFSAGREGGGYWGVAERLQAVAAESELSVEVQPSVGSIQNLERLDDPNNPVNLTLTQADALKHYLQNHPGFASELKILESIGLECVFIIARTDSGIENDQDLQDPKGHRIAIPGAESGVAVTFEYMSALVPGLANTKPVYTDTLDAMTNLGPDSGIDAVMLVHRPKVRTRELKLALEQPKTYRIVEVEDRHLADKLPSGEEVYEFLDVPLIRARFGTGKSVPTICTRGLLVTSRDKLTPVARDRLKKIIDFQWMRIYPTDL